MSILGLQLLTYTHSQRSTTPSPPVHYYLLLQRHRKTAVKHTWVPKTSKSTPNNKILLCLFLNQFPELSWVFSRTRILSRMSIFSSHRLPLIYRIIVYPFIHWVCSTTLKKQKTPQTKPHIFQKTKSLGCVYQLQKSSTGRNVKLL